MPQAEIDVLGELELPLPKALTSGQDPEHDLAVLQNVIVASDMVDLIRGEHPGDEVVRSALCLCSRIRLDLDAQGHVWTLRR